MVMKKQKESYIGSKIVGVSDTYHVSTKTSETLQTSARRVPRRRVVVAATGHTYNLRPRKRR